MPQITASIRRRAHLSLRMLGAAILVSVAACSSGHGTQPPKTDALPGTILKDPLLTTGSPTASPAARVNCGHAFELMLASATGGSASPEAAARHLIAIHSIPGLPEPRTAWKLLHQDGTGASVMADGAVLQAIQGPDHTWQIDAGRYCT